MIITISRQAATNGELIGRLVAERLGYPIYDRELVEEIARRLQVDPDLVRGFDEATVTPIQSIIQEWRTSINEMVYERLLRQALHDIAARDQAVIIGRGANFVLKGAQVLNVRLVAPLELRVEIYTASHPVSPLEARRQIHRQDTERAHFVRSIYHHDIDDATGYDLVLNLMEFPPESAIDLIIHAAQINAAAGLPAAPHATLPQHIEMMTRHRRIVRPGMVEGERKIG
jgi:cytidylate kinase